MTAIIRKVTEIGLGDNADPTKNFKILVPDVADGTLKITRGDGTAVLSINAAGQVTFPGNAQTWQDMSGSRALATTYTNSTPLPICISFKLTSQSGLTASGNLIIGSVSVAQFNNPAIAGTQTVGTLFGVVLSGQTYSYNGTGAASFSMMELR